MVVLWGVLCGAVWMAPGGAILYWNETVPETVVPVCAVGDASPNRLSRYSVLLLER